SSVALCRSSRHGRAGAAAGVADDYGNFAAGLLALHQASGDMVWLGRAAALLDAALVKFAAPGGGFYDTAADAEQLAVRVRSTGDNAEPSGTSALASALLTYSALTGTYRQEAEAIAAAEAAVKIG